MKKFKVTLNIMALFLGIWIYIGSPNLSLAETNIGGNLTTEGQITFYEPEIPGTSIKDIIPPSKVYLPTTGEKTSFLGVVLGTVLALCSTTYWLSLKRKGHRDV